MAGRAAALGLDRRALDAVAVAGTTFVVFQLTAPTELTALPRQKRCLLTPAAGTGDAHPAPPNHHHASGASTSTPPRDARQTPQPPGDGSSRQSPRAPHAHESLPASLPKATVNPSQLTQSYTSKSVTHFLPGVNMLRHGQRCRVVECEDVLISGDQVPPAATAARLGTDLPARSIL
jgi:hypothetical protein